MEEVEVEEVEVVEVVEVVIGSSTHRRDVLELLADRRDREVGEDLEL